MKRIWIDGQEYTSPEDMPPAVRRVYEQALRGVDDADGDGIPDIVELGSEEVMEAELEVGSASARASGEVRETRTSTEITINGKRYSSWDQVPEESRRLLERVMGDLPGREGALLAGMDDPRELFESFARGSDLTDRAGAGIRRTEIREVRSDGGDSGSGSRRPVPREPAREVRVELSGGWGWVVALVLAVVLVVLLFLGS